MAYRKRTLRSMSPTTRKVARLIGELESVAKRLKHLMPELQQLESGSQALFNRNKYSEVSKSESSIEKRDRRDLSHSGDELENL